RGSSRRSKDILRIASDSNVVPAGYRQNPTMIVDASDKRWIFTAVTAGAAGGLLYVPYAVGAAAKPSGGSWPGLLYAFAGTGMMTFAAVLGARKKYPTLRIGRVQAWMRGHVW